MNRQLIGRALTALALAAALPLGAPPALAEGAPAIVLSPSTAPPGTAISVSGSAFGDQEAVDLYFDTTDEALAVTDESGAFSASITIPSSASYEMHWVTAIGRRSGLAAQVQLVVAANWPQYRHGPFHQGYDSKERVLSPTTVAGVGLDWLFTTDAYGDNIDSSPAVANGVLYVGSDYGYVYALNATTGAQLWSYATGGGIYSSPAVANGVVYIGSGDHNIYALNATTGALLWSHSTGGSVDSSPAVANGVVYIGSGDHKVYALNASTGTLLWSHLTGGGVFSSPAVANGVVYVGSKDHKIYALNASTGSTRWSYTTGYPVYATLSVANGLVYMGSANNKVFALSASTGALRWAHTTIGGYLSSPAVADGVVYAGSIDGYLYALNADTGATKWTHLIRGEQGFSAAAVANGVVFVGSNTDRVCAVKAATGAGLWCRSTAGYPDSPIVANGVVYVGSGDFASGGGYLYAFGLAGGNEIVPRPNPAALRPSRSLTPASGSRGMA